MIIKNLGEPQNEETSSLWCLHSLCAFALCAWASPLPRSNGSSPQQNPQQNPQPTLQLTPQQSSTPEMTLKLSHHNAVDQPIHEALTKWATMINEQSGGKITIDIYPAASLYNQTDAQMPSRWAPRYVPC